MFAPRSSTVVPFPDIFGSVEAIAGRVTPSIVFIIYLDKAINAPVFPALTAALAFLLLTSSTQSHMEVPFPFFKALDGVWSIDM